MVYFIQLRGRRGPIKIGYTRSHDTLRTRFDSLQHCSPYVARLLGVLESAGPGTEKALHRMLRKHRLRGEWYRPHADVLEVVEMGRLSPRAIEADPAYRKLHAADDRWAQSRSEAAASGTIPS